MRKATTILLALVMVLSLAACGASSHPVAEEAEETIVVVDDISGRYIDINSGAFLALNADGTGIANVSIDQFSFGHDEGTWVEYYPQYTISGSNISITCDGLAENDFMVESTETGYHLKSDHYTFIPEEEFYCFENIEIYQVGDSIATNDVEFILSNVAFIEAINPNTLWDSTWIDSFSNQYVYEAPEGMKYLKLDFALTNNSKKSINPDEAVSFTVVYGDGFVFKPFESANNYLVKEPMSYKLTTGSNGSTRQGDMTLPSLNSHNYTAYILVSSVAEENMDDPLKVVMRLPDGDEVKQFVYDARGKLADAAADRAKYSDIIQALTETDGWYFNGGSDTTLNKISFTEDTATIAQVYYDGNGKHDNGSNDFEYLIDDNAINVTLADGSNLEITYQLNGDSLVLGNHGYMTIEEIDAGLQGYWNCRYSSTTLGSTQTSEQNILIDNGSLTSETASSVLGGAKGDYYYYGPYYGSYVLNFGGFDTELHRGGNWFFNIIEGNVTLLYYDHVCSHGSGLPGENGYSF